MRAMERPDLDELDDFDAPPPRRPIRGAGVVALVALAVIVAAELLVRMTSPQLAEPLVWRDWEAQNKAERMTELGRDNGASIVVLGSSMANAAFDAERFTHTVAPDRPAFNAALDGSDVRTVELWGRQFALPELRPDVVVIGVSSRELNDNGTRQDEVYQEFADAPAGRRLAGGGSALDRAEWWAGRASFLVRYRTVLRRPASAGSNEEQAFQGVSRLGTSDDILRRMDETYRVTPRFRRAAPRTVLRDFAVGGQQMDSLNRLVDDAESRGTDVLLVNMPVTDDLVEAHPGGAADYERFRSALREFAAEHSARLVDVGRSFPISEFRDQFHLNRAGRVRFTRLMIEDLCPVVAGSSCPSGR